MTGDPAHRVPARVLGAFSAIGLPMAALAIPLLIYLPPYFSDELGLGLSVVGTVLLVARLFDVVSDPAVGLLSDRVRTRWGRRRPWMIIGLPLTLLGTGFLFLAPVGVGWGYLLAWSLVATLGWTALSLPHNAWAAELSTDYHERVRIYGAGQACAIVGTVLGVLVPGVMQAAGADRGTALAVMFGFALLTLPASIYWLLREVPEPVQPDGDVPWDKGLRLLVDNRPFRRLLAAYLLNGIANGLPASLFLLFVQALIGDEQTAGVLLLVYFGAGFAGLPLWIGLARRVGKHRAWCMAMLFTCAIFMAVPFIQPGQFWFFLAVCLLTGLTVGADLALPSAMQADVIDLDTAQSGNSRAGLFFALWGMATKAALALSVGLAYPILDWAGLDARGDNTPFALMTLALLYGGVPVLIKLAAIALMWRFPLAESDQRAARRQIVQPA